jgi:hypothetical protein
LKDAIGNFWTFAATLLFLPVLYGLAGGLAGSLSVSVAAARPASCLIYFACGVISYFAFQLIFSNPIRIYVFGHELTHALAGVLSGGKVKSFKAGKSGGSVTLTKAGLFATLAPYFIPIYSLILSAAYGVLRLAGRDTALRFFPAFMFLFGAGMAFHASLTVFAITQGQPDLKRYGIVFSLAVVLLFNVLLLETVFAVFFKAPVGIFLRDSVEYTRSGYESIYDFGAKIKWLTLKTITRN